MDTPLLLTSTHPDFPALAHDQQADAHLVLGNNEARCSLWWTNTALHNGHPIGAIGHYAANNDNAANILLTSALKLLQKNHISLTVGPLDGNTWRRYRFVTQTGTEPSFFLEPQNPPHYLSHFEQNGFTPLAEYYSALCSDLSITDPRLPRIETRLREQGITIRPFDPVRFEQELHAIYEVSRISFVENFLYTPLDREAFLAQYLPLKTLIDPRLILLAEHENRPVGYVFALPDHAQTQRGETCATVILKTAACLPGRRYAGLGALLVGLLHRSTREHGWHRIIHALMHESNNSRNLSDHYATSFRRYTLFARPT